MAPRRRTSSWFEPEPAACPLPFGTWAEGADQRLGTAAGKTRLQPLHELVDRSLAALCLGQATWQRIGTFQSERRSCEYTFFLRLLPGRNLLTVTYGSWLRDRVLTFHFL
jgi:hypothetical protein